MDYEVYFDFRCPFVHRAAALLRATGRRPRWRYFSLTQVNAEGAGKAGGWTVWDAPADEVVRGRPAFLAAEAAARQGLFEPMHSILLRALHEQDLDIDDPDVLRDRARVAGLDLDRFDQDLADPALVDALRRDHLEGVEEHRVFGTPTFVAPGGGAAYVRLREVPAGAEADRAIRLIEEMVDGTQYLAEFKRPA